MNKSDSSKAMRLEMVEIDHNRFAAEILRGNARINMTQMAKPFGESKKPTKWLRTDEAKAYIKAISEVQKCPTADLVEVRQGGQPEMWFSGLVVWLFGGLPLGGLWPPRLPASGFQWCLCLGVGIPRVSTLGLDMSPLQGFGGR